MLHPDNWFNVNTFIFFVIHSDRDEGTGNNVLYALRKYQPCPLFPFGAGAANGHGFMTGLGDACSCPHMKS